MKVPEAGAQVDGCVGACRKRASDLLPGLAKLLDASAAEASPTSSHGTPVLLRPNSIGGSRLRAKSPKSLD
jgi:hypothetical protein